MPWQPDADLERVVQTILRRARARTVRWSQLEIARAQAEQAARGVRNMLPFQTTKAEELTRFGAAANADILSLFTRVYGRTGAFNGCLGNRPGSSLLPNSCATC
jgi:hypothetical protein